jgi:hypothetical protein
MNIFALIAAFGGGVFAASIGALPAFIMTGVFAVVGAVAGICGADGGFLAGYMAFGSFFGPHVSFAAGVAAAAYAKKKGYSDNGANIVACASCYNKADVLLVGGIFGVIGFLIKELIVANLFAGTISPMLVTDGPGIVVFTSGVIVRLVFGGKLRTGKETFSKGDGLVTTIMIAIGYSIAVAGVYLWAAQTLPEDVVARISGNYAVLIFGMAAVGLFFAEMGQAFFGCHHIVIIAAEATVQSYARMQNMYVSLIVGVIFGVLAAILADFEGHLLNSGTDSHIDPPAFAIFIMTFVVNACFPAV